MNLPETTARKFYDAFIHRDGETMASLYAPNAAFSDPVFPDLQGEQIGKMWRSLCKRSKDIQITYEIVRSDSNRVWVHWDALYTFSGTGRRVHNRIDAILTIENGKITRHIDDFSFWRWSRQALGVTGWILGWTPLLKNKVRQNAAKLIA